MKRFVVAPTGIESDTAAQPETTENDDARHFSTMLGTSKDDAAIHVAAGCRW